MKRPLLENLATFEMPYVTVPELADHLGCDQRTVVRMIEAGKLPAFKVGRRWRVSIDAARRAFPSQVDDHVSRGTNI